MESYYDIVGVNEDATQEEIKEAYKNKAKELHPDKGGDVEKFKELSVAYKTLGDEEKRKHYNDFGEEHSSIDEVTQMTAQCLMEVVKRNPDNIKEIILKMNRKAQTTVDKQNHIIKEEISKIRNFLKRIESKPENDFVTDMLEADIADKERQIEANNQSHEVFDRIIERFEEYVFTVREEPNKTFSEVLQSIGAIKL